MNVCVCVFEYVLVCERMCVKGGVVFTRLPSRPSTCLHTFSLCWSDSRGNMSGRVGDLSPKQNELLTEVKIYLIHCDTCDFIKSFYWQMKMIVKGGFFFSQYLIMHNVT